MKLSRKEKTQLAPTKEITREDVRNYSARVVETDTALQRIRRDPDMSLHKACTAPHRASMVRNNRFVHADSPAFAKDLKGKATNDAIAAKWQTSRVTVAKYRESIAGVLRRTSSQFIHRYHPEYVRDLNSNAISVKATADKWGVGTTTVKRHRQEEIDQ